MDTVLADLDQIENLRRSAIARLAELSELMAHNPATAGFALGADLDAFVDLANSGLSGCEGITGLAVGMKYVKGIQTSDPAIVVSVKEKRSKKQLSSAVGTVVPKSLKIRSGLEIATDVVSIEKVSEDEFRPGVSVEPAPIENPGALACFASTWSRPPRCVALTAGHVSLGYKELRSPAGNGQIVGARHRWQRSPTDSASYYVDPPQTWTNLDGSTFTGWRAVHKGDIEKPVYLYRATTKEWAPGRILYLATELPSWGLKHAIIHTAIGKAGDSGGPLIDQDGYILGIHCGGGTKRLETDGPLVKVSVASAMSLVCHELKVTPRFG